VDKPIDLSAAELVPALAVLEPQVDAAAHRASPTPATAEPEPKVDPEAHKPKPAEIVLKPELREFHLTNGERVAGVVLSETPEAVYVEHATLGVLTIPRGEIAKRLVEIILLNGDRIVGDIMAETADMLYVRHASLGMLSVPRAAFTVIKSSTLGTVTVPHDKIAMLNRKVEQIEMKTLNAGPPQLRG
jgi:RNase P/RNase MRP subunit p29